MDVLHQMESGTWGQPFTPSEQRDAVEALEQGRVLSFPKLAFCLRPEELRFLAPDVLAGSGKNVCMEPDGRLKHTTVSGKRREQLRGMMQRFAGDASELVESLFPAYRGRIEYARTSLRPVEIEGRRYRPTDDDSRLHVDAFPSTPLHGRRILRVFANVNAEGRPRRWILGEPFEDMARKILPKVKRPLPGASWVYAMVGATTGRRSRYDELMLGLHDGAKLDPDYQRGCPKRPVDFAAGTAWICFTDQVMHAATKGQHALEQTFYVPLEAMTTPARAPLRVLETLTGCRLV